MKELIKDKIKKTIKYQTAFFIALGTAAVGIFAFIVMKNKK